MLTGSGKINFKPFCCTQFPPFIWILKPRRTQWRYHRVICLFAYSCLQYCIFCNEGNGLVGTTLYHFIALISLKFLVRKQVFLCETKSFNLRFTLYKGSSLHNDGQENFRFVVHFFCSIIISYRI